jgi:hypothetical protein
LEISTDYYYFAELYDPVSELLALLAVENLTGNFCSYQHHNWAYCTYVIVTHSHTLRRSYLGKFRNHSFTDNEHYELEEVQYAISRAAI